MGISYGIIIFGLPLTYAYSTLRQSVAGNSTFRGILFCNLSTPKPVISNFTTPYSSPSFPIIWSPQRCSRWTKNSRGQKKLGVKKSQGQNCINSFLAHIAGSVFLGGALRVPTSRVVLKRNSQRFFSADFRCVSASHHFALFFLRRVA